MLNGNGELPAFPMRVACEHMDGAADGTDGLLTSECGVTVGWGLEREGLTTGRRCIDAKLNHHHNKRSHRVCSRLIVGLADAVGVFYNYTKQLECYDPGFGPNPETDEDGNFWDYQW
jgi:hypothetical protein